MILPVFMPASNTKLCIYTVLPSVNNGDSQVYVADLYESLCVGLTVMHLVCIYVPAFVVVSLSLSLFPS